MSSASTGPIPPYTGVQGPVIVAHRGGALEAPENTLAAIEHGVGVGSDWQEIDVTLSKDHHVVVIHDKELDRTTNGTGAVAEHTLAELQLLEAGKPTWTDAHRERLSLFEVTPPDFAERFAGQTVPTLEQVLAVPKSRLMIELKEVPQARRRDLARGVVEQIRNANAFDRVIVGSFDDALLWAVHDVDPALPMIGISESSEGIDTMLGLPVVALAVRVDLVSEALQKAPAGIAVWGWTAYSPTMAEALVSQGAHGIITDVPSQVVKLLRPEPNLYIDPGTQ